MNEDRVTATFEITWKLWTLMYDALQVAMRGEDFSREELDYAWREMDKMRDALESAEKKSRPPAQVIGVAGVESGEAM